MNFNNKYSRDIDAYWGNHWSEIKAGVDVDDPILRFKFRHLIKPVVSNLPYGAKICEIGSGMGQWLFMAKAFRPDLEIYGADLSERAVEIGRSIGINVVHADTRDLPWDSKYFDAVFSWGVVEHMVDSHIAVKEQYRITKEYFVFDVPYRWSPAHISTRRAIAQRGLDDYSAMIEFGRFFDRDEFGELIGDSIEGDFSLKIFNNYLVLPPRLRFIDNLLPEFIRLRCGHNIGCCIRRL